MSQHPHAKLWAGTPGFDADGQPVSYHGRRPRPDLQHPAPTSTEKAKSAKQGGAR
jgi:hypothetical protein